MIAMEWFYDLPVGVSLPLFVFQQARLPLDQAVARAFGAGVSNLADESWR